MDLLLARVLDLALAGAAGLAWLWFFYRQDRYEPEPKGLVALGVVLGAGAFLLARSGHRLLPGIGATLGPWARSVLVVALPEELIKGTVLAFVFARHREFNEPMDGIVYGASIGVGFATVESALVMGQLGRGILVLRLLFTTALHVCTTALVGYGMGLFKFQRGRGRWLRRRAWAAPGLALIVAVAVHGLFDGIVAAGAATGDPAVLGRALGLLAVCVVTLILVLDTEVDEALARSPFRPLRRRRRRSRP